MTNGSINKIVVRTPNWIGDVAMAVPALRELSRIFAEAEIVLLTKAGLEGLFEDNDFADRVVPFVAKGSKITRTFEQADLLSSEDFDLAVILPNSFESALTARLARIPRRIGYNKDLRGLLLTEPIAVPEWKDRRHEVYFYLNLVAETERRLTGRSTVGQFDPDTALSVSEERQRAARSLLSDAGIDLSKKIAALGPGSTNSIAKRWGADKFAELSDRLKADLDVGLVLVGAPSEADISREVRELAKSSPVDLTGRTDIAEAAALLSVADLLVSNDMGLAHVAPAVGTGTVVIFGPTNPVTTRPFSENAVVVRNEVECSPCMLRECPIDHRCMTGVTVDHVLSVCRQMLYPESGE